MALYRVRVREGQTTFLTFVNNNDYEKSGASNCAAKQEF